MARRQRRIIAHPLDPADYEELERERENGDFDHVKPKRKGPKPKKKKPAFNADRNPDTIEDSEYWEPVYIDPRIEAKRIAKERAMRQENPTLYYKQHAKKMATPISRNTSSSGISKAELKRRIKALKTELQDKRNELLEVAVVVPGAARIIREYDARNNPDYPFYGESKKAEHSTEVTEDEKITESDLEEEKFLQSKSETESNSDNNSDTTSSD